VERLRGFAAGAVEFDPGISVLLWGSIRGAGGFNHMERPRRLGTPCDLSTV
jgi:hypothetical protein